jgi:two-component system, OmpR family, response regulator
MSKAISPMRVLVIDDDRAICEFMETFLAKDGIEVRTVSDPEAAPEEVKNGAFHMVVLDLMMPKMDGVEVLQRIRKVDSDIAVVIFTGFTSLDSAVQSMKLDALDYLK